LREKLLQLLDERDLTVSHLAYLSGVPDSTIRSYLKGLSDSMSFKNVTKIAEVLEVSLDELREAEIEQEK